METKLFLDIRPQPDQTTCGPTCLHAVYRYFNDHAVAGPEKGQIGNLRYRMQEQSEADRGSSFKLFFGF